jgi:hypothetical protein
MSRKVKMYKTIILPVVLYGYEAWSHILKEKNGLTVFESRMLRKIFGPKRHKVAEVTRRLHNLKLFDLTPHQICR